MERRNFEQFFRSGFCVVHNGVSFKDKTANILYIYKREGIRVQLGAIGTVLFTKMHVHSLEF
jgi:hypothetical protein